MTTWLRPFFIKMTTPRYHPARHLNKHGAAQHALSRDGGTAARTGRSPQPPMTAQNLLSLTPATTEPHTTAPVSQLRWRSPRTDHAVNTATCGRTSPTRHFKHSPQQRQQERSESAGARRWRLPPVPSARREASAKQSLSPPRAATPKQATRALARSKAASPATQPLSHHKPCRPPARRGRVLLLHTTPAARRNSRRSAANSSTNEPEHPS
jgi:hypothetical protein